MSAERRRLTLALLLSLLIHTLLLSLTFGGQGLGLPGFGWPWAERRIEAPDLRVVLVPVQVTAAEPAGTSVKEAQQPASTEQSVAGGPAMNVSMSSAPPRARPPEAIVPKAKTTAQAEPEPVVATAAAPARAPVRSEGASDAPPPPTPWPEVIAMDRPDEATWVVPPPSPVPAASSPATVMPASPEAGEAARERVVELAKPDPPPREAPRQADPLEAVRAESERQAAAQLEAERQAAARQEAARAEAARLEAQRQEAARQAAAQLEAERQEVAREAVARQAAARVQAEQEEDARREARRRAMGRQLDEEAARREAAATAARSPSMLPFSLSTARRVRLWGRTDPNVELVQYAEAWARKIQLNTPVDTVREVAKRPHTNPMVTVAIRSDGSVESTTIVVSSGVAEVDEAIRRIVQSHVPYQAFPPGLAREYDVVEIRRTWHFDTAIRLD